MQAARRADEGARSAGGASLPLVLSDTAAAVGTGDEDSEERTDERS
jgi:hypothetical protein